MNSIFQSILSATMTPFAFIVCMITSLVLGLVIALTYIYTTKRHSSGFVVTLALIPAVVQIIILLVNGNLGAGVAVAGTFSLVRFRSIPGTAKEIGAIFIALATGLATGMGYIGFAVIFTAIMIGMLFLYTKLGFGATRAKNSRSLTVVIPESLNYTEALTPIMRKYTSEHDLVTVKTTNMGSLFKLTYEVKLKDPKKEKAFIDELRCRNGNLEIICGQGSQGQEIL
ncbi:MAG: DUF4956 domain-containing protein [Oscillospiraceae bacterium]|nr:DUF4956 domain-containing protein [Oscillospiraceae bacterium]